MNGSMGRRKSAAMAIPIALVVCLTVSAVAGAQGLAEIAVVIESFQRLAMLEPSIAGEVWMDDVTYAGWYRLIEDLDNQSAGGALWFVHTVPLATSNVDGMLYGSLYSPWLGLLVAFQLDESATTIVGVALEYVADPIALETDPVDLAIALTDSISAGAEAFEKLVGTALELDTGRDARSTLKARLNEHAANLLPVYAADIPVSQSIATVLDSLISGRFSGPLSLVGREDEAWFANLAPVSLTQEFGESVVVLASPGWPYQLLWLEMTVDGAVTSASLLRLFDRVTTRGSEDT